MVDERQLQWRNENKQLRKIVPLKDEEGVRPGLLPAWKVLCLSDLPPSWTGFEKNSLQDCLLKKAWVPMQFNQFKLCAADMLQFPSDTIKWMTSHGTVKPRGRVDRDPIYLLVGRHCRLGTSANSSHQGPLGLEECAMIVLISYNKKAGFPQIRWCFASLLLLNQRSSYTIWKQCLMPNKQVTRSNQVQSVCRSGTIYLFCI